MSTPTNRILMIEDDPGIRRFVRLVLEDEGWQVFEADSARRGLIEAASRQPDLVILDLGLPDADGKQVLTELRGWSSVPVLVLSAREREDEKVAALHLAKVGATLTKLSGKQASYIGVDTAGPFKPEHYRY